MIKSLHEISLYVFNSADFYKAVEVMLMIRSLDDFFVWFDWLQTDLKIIFGLVIFGVLYLVYLFFAAMFSDKYI